MFRDRNHNENNISFGLFLVQFQQKKKNWQNYYSQVKIQLMFIQLFIKVEREKKLNYNCYPLKMLTQQVLLFNVYFSAPCTHYSATTHSKMYHIFDTAVFVLAQTSTYHEHISLFFRIYTLLYLSFSCRSLSVIIHLRVYYLHKFGHI